MLSSAQSVAPKPTLPSPIGQPALSGTAGAGPSFARILNDQPDQPPPGHADPVPRAPEEASEPTAAAHPTMTPVRRSPANAAPAKQTTSVHDRKPDAAAPATAAKVVADAKAGEAILETPDTSMDGGDHPETAGLEEFTQLIGLTAAAQPLALAQPDSVAQAAAPAQQAPVEQSSTSALKGSTAQLARLGGSAPSETSALAGLSGQVSTPAQPKFPTPSALPAQAAQQASPAEPAPFAPGESPTASAVPSNRDSPALPAIRSQSASLAQPASAAQPGRVPQPVAAQAPTLMAQASTATPPAPPTDPLADADPARMEPAIQAVQGTRAGRASDPSREPAPRDTAGPALDASPALTVERRPIELPGRPVEVPSRVRGVEAAIDKAAAAMRSASSDALQTAAAPGDAASRVPAAPDAATPSFAAVLAQSQPSAASPPDVPQTTASGQVHAALHSSAFASELGAHVSLLAVDGVQSAELQLNPADMGPVAVQIVVDGAQAQVSFHAAQAETRQALERSLPDLAAALQGQGLTLSGGGVFQQAQRDNRGGDADAGTADGRASRTGAAGRRVAGSTGTAATPVRRSVGLLDTFV